MAMRTMFIILLYLGNALVVANAAKPAPTQSDDNQAVRVQQMREQMIKLNNEVYFYRSERYRIETDYSKNYYAYLVKRADSNIAQLDWQRSASEKLLWVVVFVVFSGVGFSGYQLWRSTRAGHSPGEATLELEAQRIRVTSSVVGVVVLAISMAFFYFFLVEVYRIRVLDMSSTDIKPFSAQK